MARDGEAVWTAGGLVNLCLFNACSIFLRFLFHCNFFTISTDGLHDGHFGSTWDHHDGILPWEGARK